jgi:hypothetical protein
MNFAALILRGWGREEPITERKRNTEEREKKKRLTIYLHKLS